MCIRDSQKAYESAARHLDKVLEYPNNKYSEDAMLMGAEMAYTAKDYEKALHIYKQLKDKAASMERRRLAKTGMSVSYTHLDVYKRQQQSILIEQFG